MKLDLAWKHSLGGNNKGKRRFPIELQCRLSKDCVQKALLWREEEPQNNDIIYSSVDLNEWRPVEQTVINISTAIAPGVHWSMWWRHFN